MGRYEVTQAQWESVMGENPARFKSPTRPVEQVSWDDCQRFIKKINTADRVMVSLPTEAQWEYACRAGSATSLPNGKILRVLGQKNGPALDAIAWYGGNSSVGFELDDGCDCSNWNEKQYSGSRAGTHPVGQKKPNDWGLYDMLGNVSEWCQDLYRGEGERKRQGKPMTVWEAYQVLYGASDTCRVIRSGSWRDGARVCRSANRGKSGPGHGYSDSGFRLVCSAEPCE